MKNIFSSYKKTGRFINVLFISLLITGTLMNCAMTATKKKQFLGIEEMLSRSDYAGAITQIESAKEKYYKKKEKVLYYLDIGMLYHYNGEYEKSNEILTKAEYAIEELFTKSISKAALSLLLNDNAMDYSGEDYEDIYLNVFKALNYLHLNKRDSAFVEIKRIGNKLNLLEDKYKDLAAEYNKSKDKKIDIGSGKNKFHNSALGRYISLLLYMVDGEYDNARIDKDKIIDAFKQQSHIYNFKTPDLNPYLDKGKKAKIKLLCFTGRAPDKIAKTLYIHTKKNMVLVVPTKEDKDFKQEISGFAVIPFPGVEGDYHFKFQLPYIKKQGSSINKIQIKLLNSGKIKELRKIESIENVAVETFNVKKPIIYLKTIMRTLTKGILAAQAKKKMKKEWGLGGLLAGIATDVAVDATENADLRIARFFPANAHIAEIDVEPGIYHIIIEYYSSNGQLIFADDKGSVDIKADKFNFFESFSLK